MRASRNFDEQQTWCDSRLMDIQPTKPAVHRAPARSSTWSWRVVFIVALIVVALYYYFK